MKRANNYSKRGRIARERYLQETFPASLLHDELAALLGVSRATLHRIKRETRHQLKHGITAPTEDAETHNNPETEKAPSDAADMSRQQGEAPKRVVRLKTRPLTPRN